MLQTQNLVISFSHAKRIIYPDILLGKGEQLAIKGNSGSGKTTLLYIIAGLIKPSTGKVYWGNTEITSLSETQADQFRATHIGFATQKPFFIESLNVLENLMIAQKVASKKVCHSHISQALDNVGLSALKNSKITQLSGGELQRLSLARALLNKPQLVLADEPTANLDDTNCQKVIQLFIEQSQQQNVTLIVVTHDNRILPLFEKHLTIS